MAIAGGTSDARNGKIFNIFSLVDIGERSGMGLSSLYGVWEREKYADPTISQSYEPDRTKIVVEFESDFPEEEVAEKVAENRGEVAENRVEVAEKVAEKFSPTEFAILNSIRENPQISQQSIAEKMKMSRQYIGRCMDDLQSRKVIRRVGPDKGGRWEVC